MSYPTTGTCQCGKVHYKLKQPPIKTVACHCADCQKVSAGAFTITMLVKREDFELIRGELAAFDRPSALVAIVFIMKTRIKQKSSV
jgi:hypothetical protein